MNKRIIFFLAVYYLLAGYALADDVYKWVDDKGNVHFTDNPDGIPEKYRKKTQRRTMQAPPKNQNKSTYNKNRRRRAPRGVPSTRSPRGGIHLKKSSRGKVSNDDHIKKAIEKRKKQKAEAAHKAYIKCLSEARNETEVSLCVPLTITEEPDRVIQP